MGAHELDERWWSDLLEADVRSVDRSRIGDGLVGMNLRVRLELADGAARSLVVKLPSDDPTSRATGIALRNYEREVRFYREIAPTVRIRVPACLHSSWDPDSGEFVLVLEDLAPARQGDQIVGCTPDQARLAVTELARLHGPRWDDPTLDEVEWLSRRRSDEDVQLLVTMYSGVLSGFLSIYSPYLDREGIELVERLADALPDWVDGREPPFTVVHGDYRLDNLMFGTRDGGPPVAAVDWQTPGHGPGVSDASYFVGAGLVTDDRRAHERDLVEVYGEALDGEGVGGLDSAWLWHQYRRESFAGVVMAVVASQIVASTDRSEAMFAAMATRHVRHALDLHAFAAL